MIKNEYINKKIIYIMLVVLAISLVSLVNLWINDSNLLSIQNPSTQKVSIYGEYKLSNSDKICKLDNNTQVKLNGYDTVVVNGHFSDDIEKNKIIIMKLDNVNLKIYVNGTKVYSIDGDKNTNFSRSPGHGWASFESPGISKDDDIKIEFSNVYLNHKNIVFNNFCDNIYVGSDGQIFTNSIKGSMCNDLISIFTICIGIIIFAFTIFLIKANKHVFNLFCFAGMCISIGIWFFIDFDNQNLIINKPVFNNSLDIISMLFSLALFTLYFSIHVYGIWRKLLKIESIASITTIAVATITQFLKIADYYDYVKIIEVLCILIGICVFCGITYTYYKNRSEDNERFLIATYILLIGMNVDVILNVFCIAPSTIWFKTSFFIFIVIQFTFICKNIREVILENAKVNVLEEIAYKDVLTSVNNRDSYVEIVEKIDRQLKKIPSFNLDVIIIGINNLKSINIKNGYEKGNEIIKICSSIILDSFSGNQCFRIGGDEFAVIIKNESSIKINLKIIEFENSVKEINKGSDIKVNMVYGMSTYDKKIDNSYSDVFIRADNAMYVKKQQMKVES